MKYERGKYAAGRSSESRAFPSSPRHDRTRRHRSEEPAWGYTCVGACSSGGLQSWRAVGSGTIVDVPKSKAGLMSSILGLQEAVIIPSSGSSMSSSTGRALTLGDGVALA